VPLLLKQEFFILLHDDLSCAPPQKKNLGEVDNQYFTVLWREARKSRKTKA